MMRCRGGNMSYCSVESERVLMVFIEEVEDND